MMNASLGEVSFQISRLIHWNKTVLFKKINNLITHKGFYHFLNMIYDRYWTIIIFVINVAFILIHRRHSGVLPVLLRDNRFKGFIYHICQWKNLPIEIHGADFLHETKSIDNISLVDLLGRDPKYVLISALDILLKRKVWILFGPCQKQLSSKFWNFELILLLIWPNGDWYHSQKCHK